MKWGDVAEDWCDVLFVVRVRLVVAGLLLYEVFSILADFVKWSIWGLVFVQI